MKANRTWKYLTLLAVVGFWGCSSSRQTAQTAGEIDDLYGSSSDAVVYEAPQKSKRSQDYTAERYERSRDNNPDALTTEEEQTALFNDEYYSDLSARKVDRGISADPGWNSDASYNNGFVDGYNAGNMSAFNNSWRWNRWGWNSPAFWGGMSLGLGMSPWGMGNWGMNSWRYGGFYDPFYGGGYAYSPYGYDPFYGPGMYSSFYNPYYGGGWFNNRPVYVINRPSYVVGADRNRTANMGARSSYTRDRYNEAFINSPRSNGSTTGGRRSGELNSSNNNSYYSRPNPEAGANNGYSRGRQNSRGDYYYGSGSGNGGSRISGESTPRPTYRSESNSSAGDYYARPRQNSRGSYSAPSDNGGSFRQSAPRYEAPRAAQPTYSQPSRSYSPPAQSSTPSYSGGSRGSSGGSSSGGGSYSGGGSRGPR